MFLGVVISGVFFFGGGGGRGKGCISVFCRPKPIRKFVLYKNSAKRYLIMGCEKCLKSILWRTQLYVIMDISSDVIMITLGTLYYDETFAVCQ